MLAATLGSNYGIYGPAFETLEHRPRVTVDVHQHGLDRDIVAVAGLRPDLDVGRKPAEAGCHQRQARDGAGLARH